MSLYPYSQFISRNQNDILDVFNKYRELLDVHDHFVMYMDKESWELFDTNCAKVIFRHKFKHLKSLKEDLMKFRRDLINVGCIRYRESSRQNLSPKETWSLKALQKIYNEYELNFYKYGTFKKTEANPDCD